MKKIFASLVWIAVAAIASVSLWLVNIQTTLPDPPGYRESVRKRATGRTLYQFLLDKGDSVEDTVGD